MESKDQIELTGCTSEERMAFIALLAMGTKEIAEGKFVSEEVFLDSMAEDEEGT